MSGYGGGYGYGYGIGFRRSDLPVGYRHHLCLRRRWIRLVSRGQISPFSWALTLLLSPIFDSGSRLHSDRPFASLKYLPGRFPQENHAMDFRCSTRPDERFAKNMKANESKRKIL